MRLPEQRLYDWLKRKIGHVAMLERVENRVKKDTPDLYFATGHGQALRPRPLQGWIELKVLEKFPARATTPVKIPHWTTGQRYWAIRHRAMGGYTWLVVQVEDHIFVFNGAEAAGLVDTWTVLDWERYGQLLHKRNTKTLDVLDALAEVVM